LLGAHGDRNPLRVTREAQDDAVIALGHAHGEPRRLKGLESATSPGVIQRMGSGISAGRKVEALHLAALRADSQ
jgi:hypothetical protein